MADAPSLSDYKCTICLELLIEPVVMPCKHEVCRPCFRHNVEEGNFLCPICRKRIASWARKCNREGTLVNQKRWNLIQKLFPEKCLKRLKGETVESEDELMPAPQRVLAKTGEVRQEYEKEMNKILEAKEEEENASQELIHNLLEQEETVQLQQQNQQRDDELLARKIAQEIGNQEKHNGEGSSRTNIDSNISTPSTHSEKRKGITKRRKLSSNIKSPPTSYTLDRYFISKEKETRSATDQSKCMSDPTTCSKDDLELAKALQKQFDEEAMEYNKRDEYMLRKTIQGENADTNENDEVV